MKIENVLLENFGLYGGKRFRFDGQPLILIYGANESGKTTALNGLRQALFGFPHNSAYLTGKPMSAEVTVTLQDGRTVRFMRQKKRSDGFTAQIDGKVPLNESEWQALAGGLDLKSYQSLFGFSLEELRSGEKALAHAPLDEALSSSGFGGLARLQLVQHRIEEFLNRTLKRNGLGGTINSKLAEIEAAEAQLESVLTLPSDVAELRARLAGAHQRVEELNVRLTELRTALSASQRQQTALPRAIEFRQVQESLQTFKIPSSIDEEFRIQWTVNKNRLAGARSELATESRKLEEVECALLALPTASASAAHREQARLLGNQAQQIALLHQQMSADQREAGELEHELAESLRRLGCSSHDDRWRTTKLDLEQRAEFDEVRVLSESLSKKLAACHTRIELASQQLQMHRGVDVAIAVPEHLPELESLLRDVKPLLQNHEQLNHRFQELSTDRTAVSRAEELLQTTRRMTADDEQGVSSLCLDWPVPDAHTLASHQQQIATRSAQLDQLLKEQQRCQRQSAQLQNELSQERATSGLSTLADLEDLWLRRDCIIDQWREELRTPLLSAHNPTGEHAARLTALQELHAQSDSTVRSMLDAVDQLAIVIGKQRELAVLEAHSSELAAQIQPSEFALKDAQDEWNQLWSGCPFVPLPSASMSAWLDNYLQWQAHQISVQRLASAVATAKQTADQQLVRLRAAWPPAARSWSTLGDAHDILCELRSAAAAAVAQAKLVQELEIVHATAIAEHGATEQQLLDCQDRFRRTASTAGVPLDWPLSELATRIELLNRCQAVAVRIDRTRQRTEAAQKQIDEFTESVTRHAKQIGEVLDARSIDSVQRAKEWLEQATCEEQAEARRLDLLKACATHSQTVAKRRAQVAELEESIGRLIASVGGTGQEQVQEWIDLANTVFQLRARQAQLGAALDASAGGVPLSEFLEELAQATPRSVTASAASLTAQLGSVEAQARAALQDLGSLAHELEFKEQGAAAMECEQRLKRLRSELADLSEQWVVHRLAGELLSRTIDRFTRDHEPQLLKHTRRFFRELTDERYCVVEHDSGKHGGFAVRDQHGHAWQPDKLSTGTREQLYLAIRLAFITHFNEHHEPLPVIMDDCFVNFDDARARIALRTLIHWQESAQTILLSCHWRSVEALAELAPDTPVITIASGEVTTAGQLADRFDEYAAGQRISRQST